MSTPYHWLILALLIVAAFCAWKFVDYARRGENIKMLWPAGVFFVVFILIFKFAGLAVMSL